MSADEKATSGIGVFLLSILILAFSSPLHAQASPVPILEVAGTPGIACGDFNGDGFQDVITGTPEVWPPAADPRANLYLGGPSLDSIPDLTFRSPNQPWGGFGGYGSIASIGDVNRDSYSDFIVGSPLDENEIGRAYLYLGGPVLDTIADLVLADYEGSWMFGHLVSALGDINGDGFADYLVAGAYDFSIYLGGVVLNAVPYRTVSTTRPVISASRAGDLNGDGYDDFVVGTVYSALLFLGGAQLDLTPAYTLARPVFGPLVISGADLDGDGAPDIAIGAPWYPSPFADSTDTSLPMPGRVYVYRGGKDLDENADYILEDPEHRSLFGEALAIGDTNGDGAFDLVVGSPGYAPDPGRALIFEGGRALGSGQALVVEGQEAGFGMTVATSDLTGDQRAEVIVGSGAGRAFVFDLTSPLPARAFMAGGENRTVALTQGEGEICISIEPVQESFAIAEVNISSFRLSTAAGNGIEINPLASKSVVSGDRDHNGVEDIVLCFALRDLALLFADLHGRTTQELMLRGRLLDGRAVAALFSMTAVRVPAKRPVSVSPNPFNPRAQLELTLRIPGPVTIRLYDTRGRCMETVLAGASLSAGTHLFELSGRDQGGHPLASGVYFYEVRTPDGNERGRFVIAR